MSVVAEQNERGAETEVVRGVARETSATRAALHVRFEDDSATDFVAAMVSLLWSDDADVQVALATGGRRDDADLTDLLRWNREGKLQELSFSRPAEGVTIKYPVEAREVAIEFALVPADGLAEIVWLQAEMEYLGPVPILALPFKGHSLCLESFHALVGLAYCAGGFAGAEGKVNGEVTGEWGLSPMEESLPVVGRQEGAVWFLDRDVENHDGIWFRDLRDDAGEGFDSSSWHDRFSECCADPAKTEALKQYLTEYLRCPGTEWRLETLGDQLFSAAKFITVPQAGVALAIVPRQNHVVMAVDFDACGDKLAGVLLHGAGHLVLGHVRPGDAYGHWDTLESATSARPRRRWDREVHQHNSRLFGYGGRRVASIDECTPREKAMLGLWGMISDLLGGTGDLHDRAKAYQQAAYQLQAAQRLSTMLDSYGGAMLCDGVGLGKTYVATALLVHYANLWRDRYHDQPAKLADDPYRMTLVVPNSIASTWKREALPGLAQFGVPMDWIRVISHTKLSKIVANSTVLEPKAGGKLSDLEHLLLSDLVVVDEAHHFRSESAKRTLILRDMLRLQPRKDLRRKVLLLTATPINNSLTDLEQQLSLLFSTGLDISDARTPDGYLRQARQTVQERCKRARTVKARREVIPLIVYNDIERKPSQALDFRNDLDFGESIFNLAKYLKEEEAKLQAYQGRVRALADTGNDDQAEYEPLRVASELLDRVVVQRSRALCKQIEEQENSGVHLLFRADAAPPSQLRFVDEYDGTTAVLERFLPLFGHGPSNGVQALSFKVYMWYDVREGIKAIEDPSPAVGLQRILALKRLESSPVSFLISMLRLTVLHAHRLNELRRRCEALGANDRISAIRERIDSLLSGHPHSHLRMVRWLSLGDHFTDPAVDFLSRMSQAYGTVKLASVDEDVPAQLTFFEQLEMDGAEPNGDMEIVPRLWPMLDILSQDLNTLLGVVPELARIVFSRFDVDAWPGNFIAHNQERVWPATRAWASRLASDAKLRVLVQRLIEARRQKRKVIVFSQFTDSLGYIQSVLHACRKLSPEEREAMLYDLEIADPAPGELDALIDAAAVVSGDTEDRDQAINDFAPYYRIGPHPPADGGLRNDWEQAWTHAALHPVEVMFATDVLAEGVNLQDVSLLINWDIHWNPVKMIQRSGRIDRRLNPRIETTTDFPELRELAATRNLKIPVYYWHAHPGEAPETVNMILPDELEKELALREKIAQKTLAIDFTLGLERGTGAEADWMANYTYRGVSSLNAFDRDRAIERLASVRNEFQSALCDIGVSPESWRPGLNAWLRVAGGDDGTPLIGSALIGREDGALSRFSRRLHPRLVNGVPHWPWTVQIPGGELRNGYWLVLDGETFPPTVDAATSVPASASGPVDPASLLDASAFASEEYALDELDSDSVSTRLYQGITALSAGFFDDEDARAAIDCDEVFILQYPPAAGVSVKQAPDSKAAREETC